jgi:uncharacterized protein YkwD/uncharacterized membrane protein required for colicin V production
VDVNYVDLAIVTALIAFVAMRSRRGALSLTADLVSLVLAVLVALRLYSPVSALMSDYLGIPVSYAKALGFLCILIGAQVLLGVTTARLMRLIPHHWHRTTLDRVAGAAPAAAQGLIFTGAVLLLLVAMPATRHLAPAIEDASIGGPVLDRAVTVERVFTSVFGEAVLDTLAFLTVPATGGERIDLPATPRTLAIDEEAEAVMLAMVNAERQQAGLAPLTLEPAMREVARAHSQDMWERQYFGHDDPDGGTPFDRLRAGGVSFRTAGENLALAPTTAIAHQGLMNSPGHRRNIMDPAFGRIGIGVIDGGRHGKMYTQLFAD